MTTNKELVRQLQHKTSEDLLTGLQKKIGNIFLKNLSNDGFDEDEFMKATRESAEEIREFGANMFEEGYAEGFELAINGTVPNANYEPYCKDTMKSLGLLAAKEEGE